MFSSKCESSARHWLSGSCTCPETQCMMHLTVCCPTSTSMLRLLASLVSPPLFNQPLCAEPQHPGTSLPRLSVPHSCFGIWIFTLQQIQPSPLPPLCACWFSFLSVFVSPVLSGWMTCLSFVSCVFLRFVLLVEKHSCISSWQFGDTCSCSIYS